MLFKDRMLPNFGKCDAFFNISLEYFSKEIFHVISAVVHDLPASGGDCFFIAKCLCLFAQFLEFLLN
jgi:hypothetical protein